MAGYEIEETASGAIWRSLDYEEYDAFEDFLNENCFVFSQPRKVGSQMEILFGEASCVEKVRALYERFLSSRMPS